MKELDINKSIKEKAKLEVAQEKEVEYKLTYIGTIVPHENHTLYEINPKTLEVKEAEYKVKDYVFNPYWKKGNKIPTKGEVIINDGMHYISALNKKTALKKYKQGLNGSKIDTTKDFLKLF